MEFVVETKSLIKKYGNKIAVNGVSLNIRPGEIYGLIGKNGAGKTTLMKLILNLAKANSGEIRLFNGTDPDMERRKIGSLIEAPALYKDVSAFENMKRFAILSGDSDDEIRRLLSLVGLGNTGKKKAGHFSLGMKQRLGIAIALLGSPELLILDEPINGLDPAGIKEIRDIILSLNQKGVTFLISSHLLDELGKIASRYGILSHGALVEEISSDELAQKCRAQWRIVTDTPEKAMTALKQWNETLIVESDDGCVWVSSDIADSSEMLCALVDAGVRVYELRKENIGFEEFFIERMGR